MLRVVRCKSRTPKCFSSAATWFVTDDVEIPRRCAALLKPPASTTAQNTCIAASLSMYFLLFDYDYPRYGNSAWGRAPFFFARHPPRLTVSTQRRTPCKPSSLPALPPP